MATNATFDSLPENVENFFEDEGLLLPNVTLRRIHACTKAFSDDWWRLQDAVIEVEDVGVLISDPKYYRTRKRTLGDPSKFPATWRCRYFIARDVGN